MNDVTVLTYFTPYILIISKITSIREVSNSNKKQFNQQSTKTLVKLCIYSKHNHDNKIRIHFFNLTHFINQSLKV